MCSQDGQGLPGKFKEEENTPTVRKRTKGRGITTLINGNTGRDVHMERLKKKKRDGGGQEREKGVCMCEIRPEQPLYTRARRHIPDPRTTPSVSGALSVCTHRHTHRHRHRHRHTHTHGRTHKRTDTHAHSHSH